jgi:outer membrane protein assembly factor BamB
MRKPSGCFRELLALTVSLALATRAAAENWPGFRGPTGMGISAERELPTTWNGARGENVRWKTPLRPTVDRAKPDHNQSSPIVWNDQVFICTVGWPAGAAATDVPRQHVTCYRISDGQELWDTVVPPGPWKLTDLRGGYGAPTPATDGKRVYVAFGSATLAAIDLTGKILWQHNFENPTSIDVAFATSPVVFGDRVILLCDKNNKHSTLTAFDGRTGAAAWSRKRPDVAFNHSTPVLVTIDGKPQLLVAASNALQGIDPTTGELLWSCKTPGDVASPVFHDGTVYTDSGRGGPGIAVAPAALGDLTATKVKWNIAQIPEGLSSPVVAGGFLFRAHNPGVLKCFRWDDGQLQFAARLNGVSTSASPIVTADGLVYFASGGKSYVVRPGEKLDVVATNDLDDPSAASPAVSQGRLFIKGSRYLYCIGRK